MTRPSSLLSGVSRDGQCRRLDYLTLTGTVRTGIFIGPTPHQVASQEVCSAGEPGHRNAFQSASAALDERTGE